MDKSSGTLAVFGGAYYYPCGGWEDFKGFADTIEQALRIAVAADQHDGWFHIVDLDAGKIVVDLIRKIGLSSAEFAAFEARRANLNFVASARESANTAFG